MAKNCPRCGLINPPTAQRCDCGYDFATGTMKESYLGAREQQQLETPSLGEVALCVLLPIIGLILGVRARSSGRRGAGNKMLLISVAAIVIGIVLRLMFVSLQSR